jgi:hypothetical protein
MLENVLSVEVARYSTIIEEVRRICTMTGFGRRFLVEYLGGEEFQLWVDVC